MEASERLGFEKIRGPQVAIIMGSKSDKKVMDKAIDFFEEIEITYSVTIASAHRTPRELTAFSQKVSSDNDTKVILAGAGMNAALPGMIAAYTLKPVVSVPISGSSDVNAVTALLSTVQMPPGVPVLSVGVDAAKNAALATARILGITDMEVRNRLQEYINKQCEDVIAIDKAVKKEYQNNKAKYRYYFEEIYDGIMPEMP